MPEAPASQSDQSVRTVSFVSLGCPKNLVDSEKMLGLLATDGLAPVSHETGEEDADAIVINTCGFLEASKEESLEVIREAIERKNRGDVKRVVVAGCLVQRHRNKLLEWAPGIDALIGVFDRDHIVEAVRGNADARTPIQADPERPKYWIAGNALQAASDRGIKTIGLTVNGKDGKGLGYFEDDSARLRLTPRHYAYLRISEGCNQNCAFCTIPSIRGKMRSKPLDRIAYEAEELLRDGVFELNLIGQDTTSYGDDIGSGYASDDDPWAGGLPLLLRTVNDAVARNANGRENPGWVRLMYAYPSNFSDGMIRAMAELDHVVKYIDIPLQHASTHMLDLMRRRVTGEHQLELMHRLRKLVPGVAIRTTLITGFPGETEDDHKQLLEFIEEVGFDALGVFEYSREDGTRAGTMDQDPNLHVPAEVKARRHHEIMQLQQRIAFEQAEFIASDFDPDNALNTGHRFDVIIDRALNAKSIKTAGLDAARGGGGGARLYHARTYFQAPDIDAMTFLHSSAQRAPGDIVRAVIVGADGYDLIARPIDELA